MRQSQETLAQPVQGDQHHVDPGKQSWWPKRNEQGCNCRVKIKKRGWTFVGRELDQSKESDLSWGSADENSPGAEQGWCFDGSGVDDLTGMPCMLPLVEDAGVLMSAWASTWYHNITTARIWITNQKLGWDITVVIPREQQCRGCAEDFLQEFPGQYCGPLQGLLPPVQIVSFDTMHSLNSVSSSPTQHQALNLQFSRIPDPERG